MAKLPKLKTNCNSLLYRGWADSKRFSKEPQSSKAQLTRTKVVSRPASFLLQGINGHPAQELGIKISGLLGQDFAGESYVPDLLDAGRVHEKSDVGSLADLGNGFKSVAFILDMVLVADGLFGNAQDPL